MRKSFLLVAALVASLSTCSAPPAGSDSALRISVKVNEPGTRSKCVKLRVTDPATRAELRLSTMGARTQGRESLLAAILRDDLPQTVEVQALGFEDDGCQRRTTPDEVSELKSMTFKASGIKDETLTLQPAALSVDADRDGVPVPQDCDDQDPVVAPGKPEVCTDGKDNDCNTKVDCAEAVCAGMQCRLQGAQCVGGSCVERDCADGIDNDANGAVDCLDTACDARSCGSGGTCGGLMCRGATREMGPLCSDGVDNDGDSAIDCLDSECDGAACTDGRACTRGETCSNRACSGGAPVVCSAGVNVCSQSQGRCEEPDGGCVYDALPADAGCSDGLACTLNDRCDGAGGCLGTDFKVCDAPPGSCFDPMGNCEESTDGGCRYTVGVGRFCNDSNACTAVDTCLADGGCVGTTVDCTAIMPPSECLVATGTCSLTTGCQFVSRGGACGDGGACVSDGGCEPVDGGAPADGGTPQDAGSGDDGGTVADGGGGDAGVLVDGGLGDAGADGGSLLDAGLSPDGGLDAGAYLLPSNFQLNQLPTMNVPAHYDVNCSGTITLNAPFLNAPAFVPDELTCFGPALPPSTRVSQGPGLPELTVFTMERLTIRAGVTLRFVPGTGSAGDRAPVFAVRGDASINGTLDVTAIPGPGRVGAVGNAVGGGGAFCPTLAAGTTLLNRAGGGAGGSFGAAGGNGGRGATLTVNGSATPGGAGAMGAPENGTPTLTPLRGGCAGSSGGNTGGVPGQAGGAVQVWARGTLTVNGRVLAAGGFGDLCAPFGCGGAGGGSGGGILLEGTSVVFGPSALLAANGGSGSQGRGTNNAGERGAYGSFGTTQAPGGSGGSQCGGVGGAGGALAGPAGSGGQAALDPSCTLNGRGGGGGGGGSVGRIRVNASSGCTVMSGARFSPTTSSAQPSCVR